MRSISLIWKRVWNGFRIGRSFIDNVFCPDRKLRTGCSKYMSNLLFPPRVFSWVSFAATLFSAFSRSGRSRIVFLFYPVYDILFHFHSYLIKDIGYVLNFWFNFEARQLLNVIFYSISAYFTYARVTQRNTFYTDLVRPYLYSIPLFETTGSLVIKFLASFSVFLNYYNHQFCRQQSSRFFSAFHRW